MKEKLKDILRKVEKQKMTVESAFQELKDLSFVDLGFAKVDHHRSLRKDFPEVIFCQNKEDRDILSILKHLKRYNHNILATHVRADTYKKIKNKYKDAVYNAKAKTLTIEKKALKKEGLIAILTAGTADIAVAEEAKVTAEILGNRTKVFYDIGVAGIHRFLENLEDIKKARVLIVIAGMDGVLPSVVGGVVNRPIIAVPTSCGYGANFSGLAPLLTMLNSCSAGVTVVNINNGFGAGYSASLINKLAV